MAELVFTSVLESADFIQALEKSEIQLPSAQQLVSTQELKSDDEDYKRFPVTARGKQKNTYFLYIKNN